MIITVEMGMLVVMETEKMVMQAQVMAVRIKQIMQIMKGTVSWHKYAKVWPNTHI